MAADHTHKYAVTAGYMTENIYVGRANKAGNAFLDKEEATDMVLAAVAQYVMRNFGHEDGKSGGMHTTFPRLGIEVEIKVWPIEARAAGEVSGNQKEKDSDDDNQH